MPKRIFRVLCLFLSLHGITEGQTRAEESAFSAIQFEAEENEILCARGGEPAVCDWAYGRACTPDWWGESKGDALICQGPLFSDLNNTCLLIRYAYEENAIRVVYHQEPEPNIWYLKVDDFDEVPVLFSDTGSWNIFDSVEIKLPPLKKGKHQFELVTLNDRRNLRVDCFIVFESDAYRITPMMKGTNIAKSEDGRILIRSTPDVQLPEKTSEIIAEYQKMISWFEQETFCAPNNPIVINIFSDELWPDAGSTAFQNAGGMFFATGDWSWNKGNRVHELHHVFQQGRIPSWFDHPIIRTYDAWDSAHEIFGGIEHPGNETDPGFKERYTAGNRLLTNAAARTDDPHDVAYALRITYGRNIFHGMYHTIQQDVRNGKLDLDGRSLTKDELIKYISISAGENVLPLFERWNGFAQAE